MRFSNASGRHVAILTLCTLTVLVSSAVSGGAQVPVSVHRVADYRARILGVFDAQTGEPLEAAEVTDVLSGLSALTTKTGTVSLLFLPEGGSLVRIRKVGYQPITIMVAVSPADTIPITTLLTPVVPTLPPTVTNETAPSHISPAVRGFEERRRAGFGHFITETELRKHDSEMLSSIVPRFTGLVVKCGRGCAAFSTRQVSPHPFLAGGGCPVKLYVDGIGSSENDLSRMPANEYGGIEFYAGPSTIPVQYNTRGSTCGVMLLWTRER